MNERNKEHEKKKERRNPVHFLDEEESKKERKIQTDFHIQIVFINPIIIIFSSSKEYCYSFSSQ